MSFVPELLLAVEFEVEFEGLEEVALVPVPELEPVEEAEFCVGVEDDVSEVLLVEDEPEFDELVSDVEFVVDVEFDSPASCA